MSVISVRGLNKWYGTGLHVLRDIDLAVGRGETLVVCGPSGSGKSTLIRTLNALEPFDEGEVSVAGITLGTPAATRAVRRKAGMVFQSFNLFTHFSVLDNLTLAPENLARVGRREAEEKARALLTRVGLADQAAKFPGQLSGGQQQRVAIARTLMMEPEVLLFDEPTSALDPEMINEVLQLMEALAAEGHTMVCVTHEMGFARNVADRIAFMADGSLLEIAPPAAFFAAPQSAPAQAFLSAMSPH